jgi:hypothetical protein
MEWNGKDWNECSLQFLLILEGIKNEVLSEMRGMSVPS